MKLKAWQVKVAHFCALTVLFSSALFSLAWPASAKTIYGDFSISLQLSPTLTGGAGATGQVEVPLSLPFRGKLYYQDGIYRIDLLFPSFPAYSGGAPSGTSAVGKAGAYQTFSLLFQLGKHARSFTLIDHKLRRAYVVELPEETQAFFSAGEFLSVLQSRELQRALAEQGVKIGRMKEIGARKYHGLSAKGYEIKVRLDLPKETMAGMPKDFSPDLTFQYLMERDTKVPLSLSIFSDFFTLTFGISNILTNRLPDILFRVPDMYIVEHLSESEFEQLVERWVRAVTQAVRGTPAQPEEQPQLSPESPETSTGSEATQEEGATGAGAASPPAPEAG